MDNTEIPKGNLYVLWSWDWCALRGSPRVLVAFAASLACHLFITVLALRHLPDAACEEPASKILRSSYSVFFHLCDVSGVNGIVNMTDVKTASTNKKCKGFQTQENTL